MKTKSFTAIFEWDPESKLYIGKVPSVVGALTQGASLDELRGNLKEVLELCLENAKQSGEEMEFPEFVGVQQIEVEI